MKAPILFVSLLTAASGLLAQPAWDDASARQPRNLSVTRPAQPTAPVRPVPGVDGAAAEPLILPYGAGYESRQQGGPANGSAGSGSGGGGSGHGGGGRGGSGRGR